ncbi:MAG TPA: glycosyltransferase N-terminal domain-containing protein [Ferruginibacter sp.]|nr:glycosyltransferase N-terminal domain-containing protein [Ferruginibacter sp.]
MGILLYNIFLLLYSIGIRVASLWKPKAKKWLQGRKGLFGSLSEKLATKNGKRIWMHCASLGEFEQGRPLLEAIREREPSSYIVLSFFSPSGYEVTKDYKGVDLVLYLPMDSSSNAKRFIDAIDPSLVLWVKYEYWFYYLDELKRRNIPVILVSGIFRKRQPFFKWYGAIWRRMLKSFTHFFVQNEMSKALLESIGVVDRITITGDTRFDRVIEIAKYFQPVPFIEGFCGNAIVIVAGSTWEEDEVELLHYVKIHPEIKFIIAPHEINADNIASVKKEFANSFCYSEFENAGTTQQQTGNVLIIDNIGMLSRLYNYATIAYVGGGFGSDGVHNVLEAAVYGKPVVFGPEYEKYDEAIGLLEAGGGESISGPLGLEKVIDDLLDNDEERREKRTAARDFVYANEGASRKIINFIQENRLLTS